MLKKEKEKFYIITAIILSFMLILIWQGIFSSRMAIENKTSEILDKKASIGAYSQRTEALPAVLANYNSAKKKIDEVNERFVSGATEVGKFFSDTEIIAFETSIKLEKAFIENPEIVKKPAKKQPADSEDILKTEDDKFLRFTAKGTYMNLLRFISKLEAMPYYIDIKSVNIGAADVSVRGLPEKNSLPGELQSIIIVKVFKKQNIDNGKK